MKLTRDITNYIRLNRNIRIAGIISSFVLVVLSLFAAFPLVGRTDSAEAAPGTPTASTTTLTMTSGHTAANLNLTPHDSNGTFSSSSSSESASFDVATNNYTGYTLSISASDDTKKLNNSTITNASLDSITTSTDAETFSSSTSSSYKNKWGYKPSKYNSATNTDFLPSPTTSASTLDTTTVANTTANNYTIGLGARVDYTKPAGSYTNTFVLTTVANPVGYSVTYADDTGDSTVANLPATQSGSVTQTKVTLSSTIPTRTNYTFLYWCLANAGSATSPIGNNGTTCTGTTFTAGDTNFGIDQTTENTTTLYAVWSPNITIKTATGISKVTLNKKATTDTGSDDIVECVSASGCVINGLVYGKSYTITATASTGYTFKSWSATTVTGSSIASSTTTPTTYTVGAGPSIITPTATANEYTITLNGNGATNTPTASTTATYNSTTLGAITTLPTRSYTISGFSADGTNASGACVKNSASDPCADSSNPIGAKTSTYGFKGWYKETAGTTQIASSASTPALSASTSYTDANSKWTSTSNQTLYAGWDNTVTGAKITLPTITKTGYTCGWATSTSATSITYASGYTGLVPTANMTLHGVCVIKSNLSLKVTFAGSGVSSVQVRTASGTGGTLMGTVSTSGGTVSGLTYNTAYYLYPTYSTGYTLNSWAKDSGAVGTLSSTSAANPTYTIGDGTNATTITGKLSSYTITLSKSNASAIVIDGTSYTGTSATLTYGTHAISGTYPTNYEFSSWATSNSTNLAITSTSTASTSITVHGAATLTLNGKQSCQSSVSGTMQAFDPSRLCSGAPTSGTLTDSRDSQSYTVAKIGSLWWMTKNLNIAGGTTLTPSTSNVASSYTLPTSSTSGFSNNSTAYVYNSGSTSCGDNSPCYSYYSYVAATAGTGASISSGDATSDICPKGWRLPTNAEFNTLKSSYSSSSALTGSPFLAVYAGVYTNSSFYYGGSFVFYWSSTAKDSSIAYGPGFGSGNAWWGSATRYYGSSVRCVLETRTIVDITNMKDVTSTIANNTAVGTTATLTDARDNQQYLVGKLADGKLWMLDNLRLGSTTLNEALSTDNTNMSPSISFTLPASSSSGFTSYDTAMINTDSANTTTTSYGNGSGKIGVYYNYCAATAGTYCMASGSGSGDASYDVCPKGWRMPTGGSSGEYQALYTAYSSNDANFRNALSTPLTGNFTNNSVNYQGRSGAFWSSTYANGSYMRYLSARSSYVSPTSSGTRNSGYAVRCILK